MAVYAFLNTFTRDCQPKFITCKCVQWLLYFSQQHNNKNNATNAKKILILLAVGRF